MSNQFRSIQIRIDKLDKIVTVIHRCFAGGPHWKRCRAFGGGPAFASIHATQFRKATEIVAEIAEAPWNAVESAAALRFVQFLV